jgi:hypothetical protein
MSLTLNRHPEFGYVYASPGLRSKARLAAWAMTFGVVLGAGGTAMLVREYTSGKQLALTQEPLKTTDKSPQLFQPSLVGLPTVDRQSPNIPPADAEPPTTRDGVPDEQVKSGVKSAHVPAADPILPASDRKAESAAAPPSPMEAKIAPAPIAPKIAPAVMGPKIAPAPVGPKIDPAGVAPKMKNRSFARSAPEQHALRAENQLRSDRSRNAVGPRLTSIFW